MRVGIDVGGTNTDAVLVHERRVIAATKQPTSPDISSGIVDAINRVISDTGIQVADIDAVMIGTTQFTNAFVERRCLDPVAAVRLCLPASQALEPLTEWPQDLIDAVGENCYLTAGGCEYDGRHIAPLDEDDLRKIARDIRSKSLRSVAISSVFAPVRNDGEQHAARIIREYNPDIHITLSSELGRIGLLERENATIMNACLATHAQHVVSSFVHALQALDIRAPLFLTQNDGTVMGSEKVARFPIMTFSSGPTNSMRGAAWLSGVEDALVIDIGGTTCDIGALVNGFPRESAISVDIGGVRTNFRMPDVLAIGLGGGSLVEPESGSRVGPRSVGYRLTEEALVFGGNTLTATDIAVAAGLADIGDARLLASVAPEVVSNARAVMQRQVEDALDRMKTREGAISAVLVGGGSVLIGDALKGVNNLVRPENFAVANAVGAAIAQVGGETDRIYTYEDTPREEALEHARRLAIQAACEAGADPAAVAIVDLEEVPLAYMPKGAVRIRVKAAGDLLAV